MSVWSFRKARGTPAMELPAILLSENNLVPFDHVAAGHEGIQNDPTDESVIFKPCTAAEIAFYEQAAQHEAFQAHMPTFMGTLTLSTDQSQNGQTPESVLSAAMASGSLSVSEASAPSNGTAHARSPSRSLHGAKLSISQLPTTKRTSWKPSGGKKLETGLGIVLENIAHGFTRPNILDVKLGARLWADDAPPTKRAKLDETSKQTTSACLGFRIAGMKVWKGEGARVEAYPDNSWPGGLEMREGYLVYDKNYGRKLDSHTVKKGLLAYLGADQQGRLPSRGKQIAGRLAREVKSVQYVLEQEDSRMYSASILFVYEGDEDCLEDAIRDEDFRDTAKAEDAARGENGQPDGVDKEDDDDDDDDDDDNDNDNDNDEDGEVGPKVHDVRLIDFAHAEFTPGLGADENALQGVRSVLQILNDIARMDAG